MIPSDSDVAHATNATASAPRQKRALRVAGYAALLLMLGASIYAGIGVRRWAWDAAQDIRFMGDIHNAFRQGSRAADQGYLNVYDPLVEARGTEGRYGLDYPPLRLLVVTEWVKWLRVQEPGIERWRNEYALTWPLLRLNLAMELASVLGLLLLVRLWFARQADALGEPRPMRAWAVGGLAAVLLWFNPALMINAHAWPQWDAWALPFFIWALLAVSVKHFLVAGLLVAVGAMLKGQILMVAPVLVLIPLLRGQWVGILKLALGFALGVVLVTYPWLLRDEPAVKAVLMVTALGTLAFWATGRRRRLWSSGVVHVAAVLGVGATAWCAWWYGSSMAWFYVGWRGPTDNHFAMHMGRVGNLAGLLQSGWRWKLRDSVAPELLGFDLPLRTAMVVGYGLTLAWCGWCAARAARHRQRVFLVAAIGPWVLMFALMPQMHERYLLWGAALSAAFIVIGVKGLLLHLLITGLASMQTLSSMIGGQRGPYPVLHSFINGSLPGMGWALLMLCGVLMWLMWQPRHKHVE